MSAMPSAGNVQRRSRLSRQACDDCKRRKVKCDSARPCSNCQLSRLSCQYTTQNRKRGPARASTPRPRSGQGLVSDLSPGPGLDGEIPRAAVADAATTSPASPAIPLLGPFGPSGGIPSPYARSPASSSSAADTRPSDSGVSSASLLGFSATDPAGAFAQKIRDDLLACLQAVVPTERPGAIVITCIDLFMRYVFPSTPIVHEASLRRHAVTYFSGPPGLPLFAGDEEHDRVARMREFALVTALCSTVSAMMGPSLLHYGQMVAAPFFHASSCMLKNYEEYDVEFPDSSSLSIRALFSGAAQHITGKTGFAVHVYGQAALLVLSLRLYDEQALLGVEPTTSATPAPHRDPVEVQLLRRNFWHIYMSDKSATSLGTRPALLHEVMFVRGLTTHAHGQPFAPLLEVDNPLYINSFEERLLVGCDLLFRLWSTGCDLLQRIREATASATPDDRASLISALTELHLQFLGNMEDLPPWLQLSSLAAGEGGDRDAEMFQKECFWVQRCTFTMAYHCLRVVIMQRCIESGFTDVMGVRDDALSVAVKKAELIQSFVQALEDIPFIYHKVKGEPSVQRIRIVGSILLEMVQNSEHDVIRVRVISYFRRLLDLLAKLNSKASEELNV